MESLYFLHIPKTAGGTFINVLDNLYPQADIFPPLLLSELVTFSLTDIEKFPLVRGHFDYGLVSNLGLNRAVATFLRDPVNRSLSQFSHSQRNPEVNYWRKNGHRQPEDLEAFLSWPETPDILWNVQTRSLTSDWYALRKLVFWDVAQPEITDAFLLDLAKVRLKKMRFFGIQERFNDSLLLFCHTFGIKFPLGIQDSNVSTDKLKNSDVLAGQYQIISDLNRLDEELYSFALGIFEERFLSMAADLSEKFPRANTLEQRVDLYAIQSLPTATSTKEVVNSEADRSNNWTYQFDQPLRGSQWHSREKYKDAYCRWTGPETVSTLEFEITCSFASVITIQTLGALSLDVLDSFRVTLNGHPVKVFRSINSEGPMFIGAIPRNSLRDRFQTLEIAVCRTLSPPLVSNAQHDSRLLGICILWIKLSAQ